jgi:hypothetical protein
MDPRFYDRERSIKRDEDIAQVDKSTSANAACLGILGTQIHFDSLVFALVDIINKYPDLPPADSVETKILLAYQVGNPWSFNNSFTSLLLVQAPEDPYWMPIV